MAGFTPEDLSITSQPNELIVVGERAKKGDGGQYKGANLNNGMLSIDLVREVPEAMKPRRIEIANSNQPQIGANNNQPRIEAEAAT